MKTFKFYFFSLLLVTQLNAFDEFLVSDIRIIGLQRVSTGSIFNVIPISVGDKIDLRKSSDITRSLFSTEQFDDIQIAKDGNTLIISVVERPSISAIDISGNKALKTEQLMESLDGVGIKEGEVYKRSTLEKVKSELVRSYASMARELHATAQTQAFLRLQTITGKDADLGDLEKGQINLAKATAHLLAATPRPKMLVRSPFLCSRTNVAGRFLAR